MGRETETLHFVHLVLCIITMQLETPVNSNVYTHTYTHTTTLILCYSTQSEEFQVEFNPSCQFVRPSSIETDHRQPSSDPIRASETTEKVFQKGRQTLGTATGQGRPTATR